jgi:uncharacterized protein (DUF2345 family)
VNLSAEGNDGALTLRAQKDTTIASTSGAIAFTATNDVDIDAECGDVTLEGVGVAVNARTADVAITAGDTVSVTSTTGSVSLAVELTSRLEPLLETYHCKPVTPFSWRAGPWSSRRRPTTWP